MIVITNAQTTGLYREGKVERLEYTDIVSGEENKLDISGCFIQVGLIPNTEWLENSGTERNNMGEIITANDKSASIKIIYAEGDATDTKFKQIVIAAGTGATAALSAYNYLMVNE